MKNTLFNKFKSAFTRVAATVLRASVDIPRVTQGQALVGQHARLLSPPEWIRWYVGGNRVPLARPTKRGADVNVDTYAYAERRRALTRNRKGPHYAKSDQRMKRAALAALRPWIKSYALLGTF